jgi:hypothetical protein
MYIGSSGARRYAGEHHHNVIILPFPAATIQAATIQEEADKVALVPGDCAATSHLTA